MRNTQERCRNSRPLPIGRGDDSWSETFSRTLRYKLRPPWARYGVALGCVLLGYVGQETLSLIVGPTGLPFICFFPGVAVSAWYGGLGAGMLAIILSAAAANWTFTPPLHAWSPLSVDSHIALFFIVASGFIVLVMQAMHRSTARIWNEVAAREQTERHNTIEAQADHRLLELGNQCDNYVRRFRLRDWKNKTDFELWPRDVAESFQQNDLIVLDRDSPFECVEVARMPDGAVSYWLDSKFWFEDESGKKYVGGVGVDITARTRAEDALREALQAKDRFLARVSHELRTPLTPVTMIAGILQRNNELPQSVRDALDVITQSVKFEAKLIDDLLDLSRANTGKFHVELSECDIHEIVENAISVCFEESNAKRLSLIKKLNASQRKLPGDALRLQQVFWNLIQNAIRFTAAGGSITISSSDANGQLCVNVSDTGRGIETAMLERIFEPFAQEDDAKSNGESQSGLGLGLAVARHIALAHGGTIVATSEGVNRGATFTVSLPRFPTHRNSLTA